MAVKTERPVEKESESQPGSGKSTAREYLESLVVTVILALFGTTFLIQAFKIPSSSMEDSLLIGDHLMVDKVAYGPASFWDRIVPYHPVERDRIIVFRYPLDPKTYFVKRVVGVPGDRIRLEDKQVFRNGEALEEPYAIHESTRMQPYRDNFPSEPSGTGFSEWADTFQEYVQDGEIVVPPDHYFVMGDNRDFSSDSRYWGFVPRENIVGQPLLIYWSFESSSEEYRRTGAVNFVGKLIDVVIHFPQKTRWKRMFHLIR